MCGFFSSPDPPPAPPPVEVASAERKAAEDDAKEKARKAAANAVGRQDLLNPKTLGLGVVDSVGVTPTSLF